MKVKRRQLMILLTSALLGIMIVMQARSFADFTDVIGRDTRADVFREIQILKKTNEGLEDEIKDLEVQLAKASDQQKALESVKQEIEKYQTISGKTDIFGQGVALEIKGDIKVLWLTDIVNELFSAGAEAVSVNNIRLTDETNGFDTIPNGQILLNGSIIKEPYTFEAIGDKKTLQDALRQPQGILQRLSQSLGKVDYSLEERDLIKMEKVI